MGTWQDKLAEHAAADGDGIVGWDQAAGREARLRVGTGAAQIPRGQHLIDLSNSLSSAIAGREPAFSKGSLVAGSNVTLGGTLANRLVGSGNVTISASASAGAMAVGATCVDINGLTVYPSGVVTPMDLPSILFDEGDSVQGFDFYLGDGIFDLSGDAGTSIYMMTVTGNLYSPLPPGSNLRIGIYFGESELFPFIIPDGAQTFSIQTPVLNFPWPEVSARLYHEMGSDINVQAFVSFTVLRFDPL